MDQPIYELYVQWTISQLTLGIDVLGLDEIATLKKVYPSKVQIDMM